MVAVVLLSMTLAHQDSEKPKAIADQLHPFQEKLDSSAVMALELMVLDLPDSANRGMSALL